MCGPERDVGVEWVMLDTSIHDRDVTPKAVTELSVTALAALNARFETASPREIVEWAVSHVAHDVTHPSTHRLALTVSFGGGGLVLAYLLSQIDRTIPVIFLDTGFHFPETLEFKQRIVERYDLNLVEMHPASDPGPLYETDPDQCCHIRKVEPMQRALQGYDVWISAVRRDQSDTRRAVDTLEYQLVNGRPVLKVYPLVRWSGKDVWRYLYEHDIPHHPLLDQGYTSIGCWPCTRATVAGEDERAGRWSGRAKTECGLHAFGSHDPSASTATSTMNSSDSSAHHALPILPSGTDA